MFSSYGSQYTLPIPASAAPKATTTARTVNYTEASMGGIMDLAKATTNFALRFTGTCIRYPPERLSIRLVLAGPGGRHGVMITTLRASFAKFAQLKCAICLLIALATCARRFLRHSSPSPFSHQLPTGNSAAR